MKLSLSTFFLFNRLVLSVHATTCHLPTYYCVTALIQQLDESSHFETLSDVQQNHWLLRTHLFRY